MNKAKEIFENKILLEKVKQLMWETSDVIMNIYTSSEFEVEFKNDSSPVTKADLAGHNTLVSGLNILTPNIPVVSEEDESSLNIPKKYSTFWLIDPLDGTKEFIKKNGEFTSNLALIENHSPSLGFVSVPALDTLYTGGKTIGSTKEQKNSNPTIIKHTKSDNGIVRVVASKSHLNDETQTFINSIKSKIELVQAGSSLKFLKIATGEADVYPRLAPTCEWDTAAAQAVLEGAGGYVRQPTGEPMKYGKNKILNPHFIAQA